MPKPDRPDFASALDEARLPYRLFVLRRLTDLESKGLDRKFPVSMLMTGEVHEEDVRNALRGLYKAALIKGSAGTYGLTPTGRKVITRLTQDSVE
jgi:hypothetical protein